MISKSEVTALITVPCIWAVKLQTNFRKIMPRIQMADSGV
jgi:hypothetical protein